MTLGVAQDIRRLVSPTVGAVLAALTATRLLHQRVLLLDRELEQVGGAALAAQLLLLAA